MEKCVDLIKFAPCAKTEHDYGNIAEAFFVNSFYYVKYNSFCSNNYTETFCQKNSQLITNLKFFQVFPLISYNPWKGLLVMYFYLLANFAWNYTDLFLSLISLSLSERFKQINTVLFRTQGQVRFLQYNRIQLSAQISLKKIPYPLQEMHSFFWRAIREDYNELSILVRNIDVRVQKLIIISMISDLYYICRQILAILK